MNRRCQILLTVFLAVAGVGALTADVTTRGQIEGRIQAQDGQPLPGARVTISGPAVIGGSRTETADEEGKYRFVNLNPETYTLRIDSPGFAPQEYSVQVHVGKTATIDATLRVSAMTETVTVQATAPLFDQTSAAHGTNMAEEELQSLPTSRDFIANVDAAAGFNNQAAYGAGGNVAGYEAFGYGAATNSYQLNGVSISNLEYGSSWVNPNYDTIEEIQIVGPGGSAEYSNYSGAVVNVVTKAGTNAFAGTLAGYFTNDALTGDNSEGIADLEPGIIDRKTELATTLGGPMVRDRLHFFASAASNLSATAPPDTEFYDDLDRQQYQLRLDFLPSARHILSGMANFEPIADKNLGLQAETGPETGFFREQDTTSGFVSWLGSWREDLISELRYAGVTGFHDRIPNSLAKPRVADYSTNVIYNSQGFIREQSNRRNEARAVVTHFADDFLRADHELKGGLEYEKAWTATRLSTAENVIYALIPLGPGLTYIQGIVNYNVNQANELERPALFVQDRATFGRATLTAGLRYDQPKTSDKNTGETLLSFDQYSPRFGLAYDLSGTGRSVLRAGAGRYFDKVPTYGIGSYAGTGLAPVSFYGFVSTETIDPTDTAKLRELVIRPENFSLEFSTELVPVEPGIRSPHVDIFNVGFDQQLGSHFALSLNYIYRKSDDFIVLTQLGDEEIAYEPVQVTSQFTGRTFTIYRVPEGAVREFALGNSDFNYQKSHFFVAEVRGRPTSKLFVDASLALERSRGTRDNNECAILSLCSAGVDRNPNFEQNQFLTEGALSQERPWTFKVRGAWQLPAGFEAGWDFRWLSGRAFGAVDYCFNFEECNDQYTFTIPIEPKDARREPNATVLNLRLAKTFQISGIGTTLSIDALNLTNEQFDLTTYSIQTNINDIYPRESVEQGEQVSSFGRTLSAGTPRQFRFGVRLTF